MTSKNPEQGETRQRENQQRTPNVAQEPTRLDARYGEIGILAVAAALPYAGGKPQARPETGLRIDQRFIEVAA